MSETVRQVVVTSPRRAEVRELAWSDAPLEGGEVVGRTLATVISPGTELAAAFTGGSHPARPGYAAVFEVERAGSDVSDVGAGDVLFCMGPHASRQRVRRAEAVRVPDDLSPEQAVLARMMGVSMTTLSTTKAPPGAKVLVTGLGLVGNLAAQMFAGCGYRVGACDPIADRRAIARNVGLPDVYERVPHGGAEWQDRTALVVECSGHESAVLDACRIVRRGGEVVLVGVPWRQLADAQVHELVREVFHRYVVLRSGWEWELPRTPADFHVASIRDNFTVALRWLAEGRMKTRGLCRTVLPGDVQHAYEALLDREGGQLSFVLNWAS